MKEKLKHGLINLRGKVIGQLLVLSRIQGKRRWKCRCTAKGCGKEIIVEHSCLIRKANPKSHCGCLTQGDTSKYKKEYHAWWDAKSRCHNPDHPSFPRYGAKGIVMCDRWRESFDNFLQDVGKCPKGMSLDRIDPHGPYAPMYNGKPQVRWATDIEQARNKKGTKFVKHPKTGQMVKAADLADELGLSYTQLRNRMVYDGTWNTTESDVDNTG